jgi:membrane protease YdiL (CAAX protease family)
MISSAAMLAAVVVVMVAANIAMNRLPGRWYVPVCVVSAGCLLVLARIDGLDAADLGLGAGTLVPGLLWAVALVLAVALLYSGVAALPRGRVLFADRRVTTAGAREVAQRMLVSIPFGTVLLEETAFRSVLFAVVTVRYGIWWAVAVSSVLFGLWHILPTLPMHESHDAVQRALGTGRRGRWIAVLMGVASTAVGGVVFALLRVWTDSILPPIGLHWALNGMGVAVAWWLARITRNGGGPEGADSP